MYTARLPPQSAIMFIAIRVRGASTLVALIVATLFSLNLAGCGGGSSTSNGTVTPPVSPSITTQPANQSVMAGQTATFTVVATGTAPLTYQWQKNSVAISG